MKKKEKRNGKVRATVETIVRKEKCRMASKKRKHVGNGD